MTRQTLHDELLKRLREKRRFLQVLAGPRQVGKTTLVRQVIKASKLPAHYASADEPSMQVSVLTIDTTHQSLSVPIWQ